MTLNKARVEGAGILGVKKGFLQFCLRPKKESTIYRTTRFSLRFLMT